MAINLIWVHPAAATLAHLAGFAELPETRQWPVLSAWETFARQTAAARLPDQFWLETLAETATDSELTGCLRRAASRLRVSLADVELLRQTISSVPDGAAETLNGELRLRAQPLQREWLARGPGFLRQLDRHLGGELPPASLTVIGVLPLRRGWGVALPSGSALAIELLLTNVDDRLPEVARLAWLVTQVRLAQRFQPEPADVVVEEALSLTLRLAEDLDWFTASDAIRALARRLWLAQP